MFLLDSMSGLLRHSMRAYFLPLTAGVGLVASAFMPWM
ncbi:uncharacterized protein METZ01_LOCUS434676, partial [marine metagenome]